MTREEAINTVRNIYQTDKEKEALEILIPELAESDDERVRKSIIHILQVGGYMSPEEKDKAFAYLEKQKEPVPIPDKFSGLKSLMLQYLQSAANRKDDTEIESDTDLWGRKILDYVWKQDEKQKEQKPLQFKNNELVDIIKGEFEGFRTLLKKAGIDYEPQRSYWEGLARLFDSSAREYVKEQKSVESHKRNKPKESWLSKAKYEIEHADELLIQRQEELREIRELKKQEQHPSSRFHPADWVVYNGPLGHAILQVKDVIDGRYTFVDNESTLLVEDSDKFLRPLTPEDVEGKQKPSAEYVLTKAGLKPYKDGNQWCILAGDNIQEGICGFGDTIEDALYEFLIDALNTQKEQKPLTTEETELNSIAFLEQMGYICIPPGKEQKSAEKQDYSGLDDLERAILRGFLSAGVENVPVTIIKETAKECLAQMKPAKWGDYTKTNLDRAIQIIKKAKGKLQGYQTDDGIYECDKAIEALEHFLYRGLEIEKPTEWSEEDEKVLNSISNVVCGVGIQSNGWLRKKQVSWLKSLPERFNLQQKVEWSEEDKKMYKMLSSMIHGTFVVETQETQDKLLSWLKSLLERLNLQSKEEWNEEDEGELQNAIDALEFLGKKGVYKSESGYNAALQAASWLKNITERFNLQLKEEWSEVELEFRGEKVKIKRPFFRDDKGRGYSTTEQDEEVAWNALRAWCEKKGVSLYDLYPKEEWSEEDEEIFNNIIEKAKGGHWIEVNEITWLITRFKSLRPQYHGDVTMTEAYKMGLEAGKASSWKPSEQEKGALRTAIYVLTEERNFPKAAGHLQAILNAFDGKESRKDWKPNEEQMDALKLLVEYVAPSEKYIVIIKNLYDDLRKLM